MKVKKIFVFIVLLLFFVAMVYSASANTVVYITKTGTKYHNGNCSFLSKTKIETSLGSAVERGYEPCSRCKPPELDK